MEIARDSKKQEQNNQVFDVVLNLNTLSSMKSDLEKLKESAMRARRSSSEEDSDSSMQESEEEHDFSFEDKNEMEEME